MRLRTVMLMAAGLAVCLLTMSASAGLVNVAPDGTASQSTTAHGGVASRANDGITNGHYPSGSVTHTNADPSNWWQVDLGSEMPLESIRLFNRSDCCGIRLSNFRLSVLDGGGTEVYGQDVAGPVAQGGNLNVALPYGVSGQSVKVQINGLNAENNGTLSLAEVQVFGGPLANVARNPNAVATQSTTRVGGGGNVAAVAIDGNTDGVFNNGSVTHTNNVAGSWWQVDLGGRYDLDEVILFNRTDCCGGRLSNFRLSVLEDGVEVYGEDFFTGGGNAGASLAVPLPHEMLGDTIRVELLGTNAHGDNTLSLAEVQVLGEYVPEPATMALLGMGVAGLAGYVRKRRRTA